MSYLATVLRIMIASPSDVADARDIVERTVLRWNRSNSMSREIVLMPWRWEQSAVPLIGSHPQALINSQGVDDSDIVIGLFGSRLGSPTPDAASGTVEELERAVSLGKPVHVYFSTGPLPPDVDTSQLDGLRQFKAALTERGLFGEFGDLNDLAEKVAMAIEHDIYALPLLPVPVPERSASGVRFRVQPQQEREISGSDRNGSPRYTTRRWLDVANEGDVDAENVTISAITEGVHLGGSVESTVIHAGQTRRVPYMYTLNASDDAVIRIRWSEDGSVEERDFHIG